MRVIFGVVPVVAHTVKLYSQRTRCTFRGVGVIHHEAERRQKAKLDSGIIGSSVFLDVCQSTGRYPGSPIYVLPCIALGPVLSTSHSMPKPSPCWSTVC